ncbi:MAG TPA: hypothetical protein VEK76_07075 [Candidatus Binatia bacterium]|nr:hypothetical protein [Candidatus Binatia bacterium]
MKANPEVIVLEDDPDQLQELCRHLADKGFHALGMRSAARAISVVRDGGPSCQPIVAIVDWDLSMAPDRSASSTDFLCVLARGAPECLAMVYTANADSFRARSEIHRAHPRAWLHDKREGDASLLERLDRVLDRNVGDLKVQDGCLIVHVPTQDRYLHREAVRLVVHHPELVTLRSDTAARAVRRFAVWLEQHGSAARVVSHGSRRYRLATVDTPAARPGARQP